LSYFRHTNFYSLVTANKKYFEDNHQNCNSGPICAKRLAEQDKKHQAELKKERDEVSRLKEQLVAMQKAHADDMEKVQSFLSQNSADVEKYKQLHAEAESEAAAAEKDLDAFKAKADTWLSFLNKINNDMASKCALSLLILLAYMLRRHMPDLVTFFPFFRKFSPF
jgi:septal ring factor EnvC (AmiA/AmiB activator)